MPNPVKEKDGQVRPFDTSTFEDSLRTDSKDNIWITGFGRLGGRTDATEKSKPGTGSRKDAGDASELQKAYSAVNDRRSYVLQSF